MASERILIIEDDPEHVEFLLTNVLSPQGYLAQTATCGQLGLQAAQEERPDLVLLGLDLQDKTVTEVLQQLQMAGNPPVILMMPPGTETETLQDLGVHDALLKSCTAQEMTLAMAYMLRQDRLAEERDQLIRKLAAANAELEHSLDEMQALCDAGQALSSSLDLQDVLAVAVQAAVSLTRAERGYLFVQDLASDELCLRAAHNLGPDHAPGFRVRVDDSIVGHVMRSGEPVLLPGANAAAVKKYKQPLGKTVEQAQSLINVPLQSQGQVVGVLGVDNVASDQDLTQRDVKHLSILAAYASSAIQNAQIHARAGQALNRRAQERLALQALAQFGATSDGVRRVAAQALTHALQLTGARAGIVALQSAYLPHNPVLPGQSHTQTDITWISGEEIPSQAEPRLEDLVRQVADSGESQWEQDTAPSNGHAVSSTYLAAPIQHGDKTLGAIGLRVCTTVFPDLDQRASAPIQQDLHFLDDLADCIADRLHHTHLQSEARAAHHKIDLVLHNITEGVYTVNSDLRITSVNPAMERITGWQESELLGQRYDEVFAPEVDNRRLLPQETLPGQALHAQTTTTSTQHTILRQDGRRIPVSGTATWLKNTPTPATSVLATMRELTPEIELEQLRHALNTIIAQSLHTPLAHVNSSVGALLQTDLSDDTRHEILRTLQTQSVKLDQLAEKVQSTLRPKSRATASYYHPVTLRPIIEQVVKYFRAAVSNRSLEVMLAPDLPFVVGDENKIELALANIIDNALVLSDSQQPIVISTSVNDDTVIVAVERPDKASPSEEDERQSSSFPVNGKHALVQDHAPQETLHTARKLIQAQGGQIWTEKQPGTNIRFCFSLPKMEARDVEQALID